MKYMLLMYAKESAVMAGTPEEFQEAARIWQALLQDAKAAGVLIETNGLAPTSSATTVRLRDGQTLTTDGPFAETHEQLGGFFMVDCPDLDEAVRWAARIPHAAYGSVEIRPLWNNA